jgi:RNA polymerase sigma-70 factor (ECF subfamily)
VSRAVIAVVSEPSPSPLPLTATGDIEPLFRAHYARLVRSLALVCGDGELAADAVQEAFVRAHVRWRRLRHYDDPVGWIRRVALNLLHDDHRRASRKRQAIAELAATETAAAVAAPEPDELADLLDALPRQQRIAVALYYVEGLPVAEVAAAMGLAEGSVKSHLYDARRRLRAVLDQEGR